MLIVLPKQAPMLKVFVCLFICKSSPMDTSGDGDGDGCFLTCS